MQATSFIVGASICIELIQVNFPEFTGYPYVPRSEPSRRVIESCRGMESYPDSPDSNVFDLDQLHKIGANYTSGVTFPGTSQ